VLKTHGKIVVISKPAMELRFGWFTVNNSSKLLFCTQGQFI